MMVLQGEFLQISLKSPEALTDSQVFLMLEQESISCLEILFQMSQKRLTLQIFAFIF